MKKKWPHFKLFFWVTCMSFLIQNAVAQVGINTTSPDASSVLEVNSTTKGFLTPRMTTAQKNVITSPANGLMVYDTDTKEYSYYDSSASTWINIKQGRSKFKRIKSTDVLATVLAAELAAGGGAKYVLDSQTLYEINGTVVVNLPIELNNAYLVGLDAGDDKLVKTSGDLFTGTTGGTVKVLTLVASGGNVFNINGGGTQSMIFRDCVIANSTNVGVLESFTLVFGSVIQFVSNTNGLIYRNIGKLLLDNQAWFGNNLGTFEKYEGTFTSIQKQGGFMDVNGTAIGMDMSSNPTVSSDGTLYGVNFAGTLSTGLYVKAYTTGSYTGFNFNNTWNVNCSGIPIESDAVAVGDVNFDLAVGSGVLTTLTTGTPVKILGTTSANNFFRASIGGTNNRIQYLGNQKRFFTINAAVSFQATNSSNTIYVIYIAKNGSVINRSKTYIFTTNTSDIFALPLQCVLELSPNDYVEVYAERYSGTSNMLTVSLNLFMK
ncbi:hypothetical protein GOQ30_16625 [Flavobacterium sp. TP390]|uniref:Cell wall anchor protein n=2 Tax=Flavobacterium profundi TaxID=1774945 RepID=A0A6I4IWF2_9FLAO|nr:hypothetical protein [Flavobacterium profundi]MVO10798.1 hypothetical protein [Flavobacterium profundi]